MRNLKIYGVVYGGLFLLQVLYFFYLAKNLGLDYPHTSYLFDPNDRFNDWINSVYSSRSMNPYRDTSPAFANYFPFFYFFVHPVSKLGKLFQILLYLSVSIGLFFHAYSKLIIDASTAFQNTVTRRESITFALLLLVSYPSQFALDRGNLDLFVAACIAYALSCYIGKNFKAFALIIGCVGALKGYPLFFLTMLIVRRRYRECVQGILVFIGLQMVAVLFFHGGIENIWLFFKSLGKFRDAYIIGNGSFHYFSDFYNFGKGILFFFGRSDLIASYYSWYALAVFGLLIFLLLLIIRVAKEDLALQASLCAFGAIIYPCVINDYKLTILYPAVVLLALQQKVPLYLLIIFAVLFAPKNYHVIGALLNTGAVLNPILLFLALATTVRYAINKDRQKY